MSVVSLGLEGMCCFKLVLGIEARSAVPACSSRDCSLVDGICLFRERARQTTPSWTRIKEMKIDVGRMRSRLLWCCKVAEEVEVLCWAWELTFKGLVQCRGHPGTYCCAGTHSLLPYPVVVSFSPYIFHFPQQTFSRQSYKVASHRDHAERPISQLPAEFPP